MDFLCRSGWENARQVPFKADASRRRYWRLERGDDRCLLMDMPPHPEENFDGYLGIGTSLRTVGLSTPAILALDRVNQFALIEDFGDATYTALLNQGHAPAPLYHLAIEAMVEMQCRCHSSAYTIPAYTQDALMDEVLRFADWYLPAYQNSSVTLNQKSEFEALFQQALADLPPLPPVLALRDFHVDNLMLLSGREGVQQCGILDFQDGRMGSPAYDLVSLVEDARRDLPEGLDKELIRLYLSLQPDLDHVAFLHHFAVLGAQRHARILGQFIRLWLRDGKPFYLQFLPRVARQFHNAIQHPALSALNAWVEENVPNLLDFVPEINSEIELKTLLERNF